MISRETFTDLLLNPYQPESSLEPLRKALEEAPYCQPLQVMYAMQLRLAGLPSAKEQLHRAAVHTFYRPKLAYLMQPFDEEAVAEVRQEHVTIHKPATTAAPSTEITVPLIGTSQSTIIDTFLAAAPKMPRTLGEENAPPTDLAQPAAQPVISETMGRIYMRQGQVDKARHIFEQLSLANPDKTAYFASLLAESAPGPSSTDAPGA